MFFLYMQNKTIIGMHWTYLCLVHFCVIMASAFESITEPWGQRTCYIADPEGNLIEIGSFNRPFRG